MSGIILQFPADAQFFSSLNCPDLLLKPLGLVFDGYWQLFCRDRVAGD
jgi:hypothetical protein